jgi:hypothetical protein
MIMLLLTACGEHYLSYWSYSTQMPEDYVFEIGEEIELYKNRSSGSNSDPWATLEIANAIILTDNPEHLRSINEGDPPQAIIQVNYILDTEDSFDYIHRNDFEFCDSEGNPCQQIDSLALPCEKAYTSYETLFVAVPVKGDYLDIKLCLERSSDFNVKTEQDRYTTIRCYYGVGDIEVDPSTYNKLNFLIPCLIVAIVLVMVIALILLRKRNNMRRELAALNLQCDNLHSPASPDYPPSSPDEAPSERSDVC